MCKGTQSLSNEHQRPDWGNQFESKENQKLLATLNRMHGENTALRRALDPAYALSDEIYFWRTE